MGAPGAADADQNQDTAFSSALVEAALRSAQRDQAARAGTGGRRQAQAGRGTQAAGAGETGETAARGGGAQAAGRGRGGGAGVKAIASAKFQVCSSVFVFVWPSRMSYVCPKSHVACRVSRVSLYLSAYR